MSMSKGLRAWVVGGGIALGLAYALSPLTVWFAAAVVGLFAAAGRGLPRDERRTVLLVLSAAVALRLVALAGLFLATNHQQVVSFFWDGDGKYLKMRGLWIRNFWTGAAIDPLDLRDAFSRTYGWTTYLYVIAYVQYLTGASPYGIHFVNVAVFMATAILLYRAARFAYGSTAALLGLTMLLFLPTPLMWSVAALKESLYVFLQVCAVAAFAHAEAKHWSIGSMAIAAVIGVAAVWADDTVRDYAGVICGAALALGIAAGLVAGSRRLAMAAALLCVPVALVVVVRRADIQDRIMTQLETRAVHHIGHVHTEGNSYRLLDQRFYLPSATTATIDTMVRIEGARFAIRAVGEFVLAPLPWQVKSLPEMAFLPQQLVWYVMVVLAGYGDVGGIRSGATVFTCLLAAFAIVGGLAIALSSGNIGTMVRHRDTIVPFVVWLSSAGAVDVMARVARAGARSPHLGPGIEARAACD